MAFPEELPPQLDLRLRANRLGHTLPDTHGQVWMQLVTLKEQDPKVFQGSNAQVEKEMVRTANLSGRDQFPIRRLVTLWKNLSWHAMITEWCRTAIGRSLFQLSLWGDLARYRIDDVCICSLDIHVIFLFIFLFTQY